MLYKAVFHIRPLFSVGKILSLNQYKRELKRFLKVESQLFKLKPICIV